MDEQDCDSGAVTGRLRLEPDAEAPVRDQAVLQVVTALGETVDEATAVELVRVGLRLLSGSAMGNRGQAP